MINSLLRSGCPDNFLPLGENGQVVFDSALQIRETLRLRKQQAVADALAIPQINESGNRVDWYSPIPGKVTSWAAASEHQRSTALHYLEHCLKSVRLLSAQCQRSEKTALRLFGSLLEKAFHFPGSQSIYLVDDKPVLTFWGFVNHNESPGEDVLACLRIVEPRAHQADQPFQGTETARESGMVIPPVPEAADIAAVYTATETAPIEPASVGKSRHRFFAVLALIALLTISGAGYLYTQSGPQRTTVSPAEVTDTAQSSAMPVAQTSTLPLMPASIVPPVTETVAVPAPAPATPPVKGALVIPPEQLKSGSTKFLNGSWVARVQFDSPVAGKPPALRYRIANNKGTVRLFNSDHVICKADVFSGLQQSGTLMIKSRGSARCDDGSRHVLPEISCKPGSNGVAECTGRFEGDNLAQITFQKVSN